MHGIDASGRVVVAKALRRGQVLGCFAKLPSCLVGMEACSTAHRWARELAKLGHTVQLMPPAYLKPYVRRGKNDAADAAAICEAVTRPSMRFVPVKPINQQATLMPHRSRDLLIRQRTQLINALRGHLAELGLVAAQGREGIATLIGRVTTDRADTLPPAVSAGLVPLFGQLQSLQQQIGALDNAIHAQHRASEASRHRWLIQLLAQRPAKVAIVALANKLVRIAQAVLARGEAYRAPAFAASKVRGSAKGA